ncbi:hypothetical protein ACIBQ6_21950 [Nonomuraea sp. NPDC049655]|uniref:hypothetical protein n=1 Tax=Nonomuraea sp. NPDC049655 TaxID=3364355 RepID=UPI00379D704C
MSETRTEYGIQATIEDDGRWVKVVDPAPTTDPHMLGHMVTEKRTWQKRRGFPADAVLVSRTVTVSDWCAI